MLTGLSRVILAAALLASAMSVGAQTQTPAPTAGERYQSIRELKDIPAAMIIPTMAFMANSLGVTCLHCHTDVYESDAKPMKDKAREMIRMTRGLNNSLYAGKTVVTCETCHHGRTIPDATPSLDHAGWKTPVPAAGTSAPLPSAPGVLARFREATGLAAIEGFTRQQITGTVERRSGRTPPASAGFELIQQKPSTMTLNTTLSHPPEADAELPMTFLRLPRLADAYKDWRVLGRTSIRSQDTVILEATGPRGVHQFYFNEGTGLLVRRTDEIETPLGRLPEQYDFEDFKKTDGLTLPMRITWSRADYQVEFRVEKVSHGGGSR